MNLISNDVIVKCLNESHEGVLISDSRGIILYVNNSYLNITRLQADIVGKNMASVIPSATLIKALQQGQDLTGIHTDFGAQLVSIVHLIRNQNGEVDYAMVAVYDITEVVALNLEIAKTHYDAKHKVYSGIDGGLIASDPVSMSIMDSARRMALSDSNIMLMGESGVGKNALADYIHQNSNRKDKPFVTAKCGILSERESGEAIFGREGGKPGLLQQAESGTLFLDEVGNLPFGIQTQLIQTLENNTYTPVDGNEPISFHVRIIAASNSDIRVRIRNGTFRDDLYYRLAVLSLVIPPLRERRGDIVPMSLYFLKEFNQKYNTEKTIPTNTLLYLREHDWPGNIRELQNAIERMVVLSESNELLFTPSDISTLEQLEIKPLKESHAESEKQMLLDAKELYKTTRKMAEALGVSHSTVVRKMKKYGIASDR
ncbi:MULTISPECIES: sigma-54 interaction domain-containing protein [Acutalibacteraceae]|uniref:sigma-54 interaction domain-containing protein n=1 Tax=Acutalibacteraceae TaxID=3082771 RepID=UPI0013E8BACB|nr:MULTISPECIES: sigma 54-interacting transcriptional regulator [Acutalibacteraceae]